MARNIKTTPAPVAPAETPAETEDDSLDSLQSQLATVISSSDELNAKIEEQEKSIETLKAQLESSKAELAKSRETNQLLLSRMLTKADEGYKSAEKEKESAESKMSKNDRIRQIILEHYHK